MIIWGFLGENSVEVRVIFSQMFASEVSWVKFQDKKSQFTVKVLFRAVS